ncbi:hypothetical protein [Pararhizobium sp.]|nr:hypothetical protein [Pararhizobium sp.]MDO9416312.1 hypothetical protein [Pararhizobium sp.]
MTQRHFLIAAAVLSALTLSGCASSGATNTTYAKVGQSGPSAVSVPLN